MPIFNSKHANMVFNEDRILSFFNQNAANQQAITFNFFDNDTDVEPKYKLTVDSSINRYRCLQYKMFSSQLCLPMVCPYVLFQQVLNQPVVSVLYQTNFVSVQQNQYNNLFCTFWSTLSPGQTTQLIGQQRGNYGQMGKQYNKNNHLCYLKYDPIIIEKLDVQNIQDYQLDDQYKIIFCTASIQLYKMYVSLGDSEDKTPQDVAVIDTLPVVLQEYDSTTPAFDISLQGSGGSMRQHNHIPHIDGTSFAFSVFHPGTSMPQLPWKTN